MNCLSKEDLYLLAGGEMDADRAEDAHRHLDDCPECARRFEEAICVLDDGVLLLARERGWAPRDPEKLKRMALEAVRGPETAPARPVRRLRRWVAPAVAAAALLLLFLGTRSLLGPMRWTAWGPVFDPGPHSQAFASRDGSDLLRLDGPTLLSPGDVLATAPGGESTLDLPGLGKVVFRGAALATVGDPDGGPALHLARGVAEFQRDGERPIPVRAGDVSLLVTGEAEIQVDPQAPPAARRWAFGRKSGGDGLPAAVSIHALDDVTVELGGSRVDLPAGHEIRYGPETGLSTAVRTEDRSRYSSALEDRLTPREIDAVPGILGRARGLAESLSTAALDESREPWERALAVWFVGELAVPGARPALEELSRVDQPPMLRAAAVRSLVLLGETEVGSYLHDSESAVAEAAVQALPRMDAASPTGHLESVLADASRPALLRSYAAARLQADGVFPELGLIFDLARQHKDSRAARIARRLLIDRPEPEALDFLREQARSGGDAARAHALDLLERRRDKAPETAAVARDAAAPGNPVEVRAAAIRLLARIAPEAAELLIRGVLRGDEPELRLAGLQAVLEQPGTKRSLFCGLVREVLAREDAEPEEITLALNLLPPDPAIIAAQLDRKPRSVRLSALNYVANLNQVEWDPGMFERFLGDPDAEIRRTAWAARTAADPIGTLSRVRDALRGDRFLELRDALPVLESARLSLDRNESAAADFVEVLGALFDAPDRPALRAAAASYLGETLGLGTPGAYSLLEQALEDEDPAVRARAAFLLPTARLADRESLRDALLSSLASQDTVVAHAAAHSCFYWRKSLRGDVRDWIRDVPGCDERVRAVLSLLPPVDRETLRSRLRSPDVMVAGLALRALRDAGDEQFAALREEVEAVATRPRPEIRCLALQELSARTSEARLRASMLDADPLVRLAAAGQLLLSGANMDFEQLLRVRRDAFSVGLRLPQRISPRELGEWVQRGVRIRILTFRTALDHSETITVLRTEGLGEKITDTRWRWAAEAVETIGDSSPEVRADAAGTLAWAGNRAHVELLLDALGREPEPAVRRAIRGALLKLTGYSSSDDREIDPAELAGWWKARSYAVDLPVLPLD